MEDPFSKSETIDTHIEVANPGDWQTYKSLRLESLTGADAEMFGVTREKIEAQYHRADHEWQEDLSRQDMFVLLAWRDKQAVGMSRASIEHGDTWYIYSAYVKPQFRGGLGKKMFARRLGEILRRGGKRALVGLKAINTRNIHIAESFGFKKISDGALDEGFFMECDLTNQDTINKINEVLNAG